MQQPARPSLCSFSYETFQLEQTAFRPSTRPSVHPPPCIEPLLGTRPCRRTGQPRLPAASPTRPLTGGLPASRPLPLPCPSLRHHTWFAAPHSVLTLGCWTQGRALLCSATAPPPNAPLPHAPWSSFQNLLSWFPASLWASGLCLPLGAFPGLDPTPPEQARLFCSSGLWAAGIWGDMRRYLKGWGPGQLCERRGER